MNHPDLPPDDPVPSNEGLLRIHAFLEATFKVDKLTDQALVDQVIQHVWGKLRMGSQEDVFLMELLTRFEEAKGLGANNDVRTDGGDVDRMMLDGMVGEEMAKRSKS